MNRQQLNRQQFNRQQFNRPSAGGSRQGSRPARIYPALSRPCSGEQRQMEHLERLQIRDESFQIRRCACVVIDFLADQFALGIN